MSMRPKIRVSAPGISPLLDLRPRGSAEMQKVAKSWVELGDGVLPPEGLVRRTVELGAVTVCMWTAKGYSGRLAWGFTSARLACACGLAVSSGHGAP